MPNDVSFVYILSQFTCHFNAIRLNSFYKEFVF
nr:MAG TPA: hypothetical protein [Caudoviricetes sp.]